MKYQPYRDEPSQRSVESCEERYALIKQIADQYKRPFSVIDIGANFGWFGHRLVEDYPECIYVGIDNKTIDPHPHIYHINRHLDAKTLADLSGSEHFDIVLALSVLHHFPDYEVAFNACKRLGEYSFFEIPGEGDEKARNPQNHKGIAKLFEKIDPFGHVGNHISDKKRPVYAYHCTPFITEPSIDAAYRGVIGYATYKLHMTWEAALIEIDRTPLDPRKEIRWFHPGINAHNYKLLTGSKVKVEIPEGHPDPYEWNVILSDKQMPIDFAHKRPKK